MLTKDICMLNSWDRALITRSGKCCENNSGNFWHMVNFAKGAEGRSGYGSCDTVDFPDGGDLALGRWTMSQQNRDIFRYFCYNPDGLAPKSSCPVPPPPPLRPRGHGPPGGLPLVD